MPGITRIHIQSDRWNSDNDWRLKLADDHAPVANMLYRVEFEKLNMPLASGDTVISCTQEEAASRYDWSEGIDVILHTISGARMTLQEKFLTFDESTITFEESKTSGKAGAWYYCTAQYYFVGYTRLYWDWKSRRVIDNAAIEFQDWLLADFPAIRRADAMNLIEWQTNQNDKDGRRSPFRYVNFDRLPKSCIVARMPRRVIDLRRPIETTKPKQAEMDRLKAKWTEKMRAWNAGESKDLG